MALANVPYAESQTSDPVLWGKQGEYEVHDAACACPGELVQPDRLHQLNHLLGLARSGPLSLAPLIIRLATDADRAASSLDAQSGDLTTTDSLPEDFFTVIPCSSRMISMAFSNRADFSFSSCNCFSSSLIRCSGVNGLFDVLGVAAPGLRRPRGKVQSCKPCLRHHTKTVERP